MLVREVPLLREVKVVGRSEKPSRSALVRGVRTLSQEEKKNMISRRTYSAFEPCLIEWKKPLLREPKAKGEKDKHHSGDKDVKDKGVEGREGQESEGQVSLPKPIRTRERKTLRHCFLCNGRRKKKALNSMDLRMKKKALHSLPSSVRRSHMSEPTDLIE